MHELVQDSPRYAVYFIPGDDSELAAYGNSVLRRTANGNDFLNPDYQFAGEEINKKNGVWQRITSTPRHYGFHATLKAPFELTKAYRESDLLSAVEALSHRHAACSLSSLKPMRLASFAALMINEEEQRNIAELASEVVKTLEPFREPLSMQDIARRKPDSLTERQRNMLERFGYPFVMEEFRFHMTLSDKLTESDTVFYDWLILEYEKSITKPVVLDRLAVSYQPNRASRFRRIAEFLLN